MITLSHIGMEYEPGQPILKDVSLELKAGSFHFLSGASGAGKTTLLGILALSHHPTKGRIRMFGREVTGLPRASLPALRRRIGIVSQDFRLLDHLTVAENVGLPLKVAGESEKDVQIKVEEMLDWIGLKDFGKVYPSVLSGGQKQRVAISRAVVTKPDILLADEPTGNLDSKLSQRLIYLFEALNRMGTTVLIASHDDHLMSLFPYPLLKLEAGKIAKVSSSQAA